MEKNKTKKVKALSTLALVEKIIGTTENAKMFITQESKPYVRELSSRVELTDIQTVFLSVFIDQCDDSRIRPRDIANHFDVHSILVLDKRDDLDVLVKRGFIKRRTDSDGDVTYHILQTVINDLRTGILPKEEPIENLNPQDFITFVDTWLDSCKNNEFTDEELLARVNELINCNQHLSIAKRLRGFDLSDSDLILFLAMSMNYINAHDDRQMRGDIDDYFSRSDLRHHLSELEDGSHKLMELHLVEYACDGGKVESNAWKLTNYAKQEVFEELNLKVENKVRSNLTRYEDIVAKPLYYNDRVTRQIGQLEKLLDEKRMKEVLHRLGEKGMRKGFTCLFHGAPGTGKTETALQLALHTKRDIMMVDLPSIRSKWVGETEQNIKAVFTRYHKIAASSPETAPILLFNEADALLNRRNEGGTDAVDKMENAMQNIILQEMENFEGIMIATTNLSGNLDDAFERRFLYKVEFGIPTPKERQHIWKAMLSDLTDKQALQLAERFDFSGGQIENIARKRIVGDILECRDTLNLESIIESCETERLNSKGSKAKIGF